MMTNVPRASRAWKTGLSAAVFATALSACTVHVLPDRPHRDQAVAAPEARAAVASLAADRSAPGPRPSEEPVMTELPEPGTTHIGARGVVAVNAPLDRVRAVVFGFDRYAEFMPNYKACHLLGTTPEGARDVRMDIEVLGGILKLWARMEVSPKAPIEGGERYDGRLVEGNMRAFHSRWEFREIDRATTQLVVESFMELKIPLPDSVVNSGSISGAREAILAIKHRAEGTEPAGM